MRFLVAKTANFIRKTEPFLLLPLIIIGYILVVLAIGGDVAGNFKTELITSFLSKPLLLTLGIITAVAGFFIRDSVKTITINIVFAMVIYNVFPNAIISLPLIISGVLWCFVSRDYFHPEGHLNNNEGYIHIIKLFSDSFFTSICFIHGTNYYDFLVSQMRHMDTASADAKGLVKSALMLTWPWLICLIIGVAQDLLYFKSQFYINADWTLYFQMLLVGEKSRGDYSKRLAFLRLVRMAAIIASGVLLFRNFDGVHYVSLIVFMFILLFMFYYVIYQRRCAKDGWILIPTYFLYSRDRQTIEQLTHITSVEDYKEKAEAHKRARKRFRKTSFLDKF